MLVRCAPTRQAPPGCHPRKNYSHAVVVAQGAHPHTQHVPSSNKRRNNTQERFRDVVRHRNVGVPHTTHTPRRSPSAANKNSGRGNQRHQQRGVQPSPRRLKGLGMLFRRARTRQAQPGCHQRQATLTVARALTRCCRFKGRAPADEPVGPARPAYAACAVKQQASQQQQWPSVVR
jgi:hypothetical protein